METGLGSGQMMCGDEVRFIHTGTYDSLETQNAQVERT
jgi:hypothetical protein